MSKLRLYVEGHMDIPVEEIWPDPEKPAPADWSETEAMEQLKGGFDDILCDLVTGAGDGVQISGTVVE